MKRSIKSRWKASSKVAAVVLTAGCAVLPGSNFVAQAVARNNSQAIFTEVSGWPIPPQYQGNPYASGGVGPSQVFYDNLIQGIRMSNAYYFRLASSIQNTKSETIVHLRPNAKWSDGQPFTSKDVWAVYTLNAQGQQLDNYIVGIQTPNAHTVVFKWLPPYPSNTFRLFLLEQAQMNLPYHYYKAYVDKAAQILAKAPKFKGSLADVGKNVMGHTFTPAIQKEWDKNWQAFTKFGPKLPISSGPYIVQRVTATDMLCVKNPYYWDSKDFRFKILHFVQLTSSNANEQYNLLTAGKIDRVDGTPPQSLLESVLKSNSNIVHYQMRDPAVLGFVFNMNHPIMQNTALRKAIIYALNRDKVRKISNVYGTTEVWAGVGMPPSQLDDYVSKSVQAKMTKYTYNPNKAAQLLRSMGWKKVNGVWHDAKGHAVHLTVAADAAWNPQWLNAGEVIAEQLTSFGLQTTFRAIPDNIFWTQFGKKGSNSADMSLNWVDVSWGNTNPWNSESSTYSQYRDQAGIPTDKKTGELQVNVKGFDGKVIHPMTLLNQLPFVKSQSQFNYYISELAYVANENAWQCDVYQNVTGAWFNMANVAGLPWPEGIKKYNRNLPVPPAQYSNPVAILNEGFSGNIMYTEIRPS